MQTFTNFSGINSFPCWRQSFLALCYNISECDGSEKLTKLLLGGSHRLVINRLSVWSAAPDCSLQSYFPWKRHRCASFLGCIWIFKSEYTYIDTCICCISTFTGLKHESKNAIQLKVTEKGEFVLFVCVPTFFFFLQTKSSVI